MDKNAFGSCEKYEMLERLTEQISVLGDNKRKYIIGFISNFNILIKKANEIKETRFRRHVLKLIKQEYDNKTDELFEKYDTIIVTYLKNFITAKSRNAVKL